MDKHLEEEALMKEVLAVLPASEEMPAHVRSKALATAIEANRRRQAARRPRPMAWMSAGLAALAFGTFFLMPKQASAKAWTMVTQAVEKITSVQMDLMVKDAKNGPERIQIALDRGEMLLNDGKNQLYIGKDGLQVYDVKSNTVTQMKLPSEVEAFMPMAAEEIAGAFNLKKEIAEMESKYGKDHIRIMPLREQDGRQVYDVQMTEPNGSGKAFLTVDANTDLPIFIDASGSEGDGDVVIHLRYNDRIQLKPNFPAGATIKKIDLSQLATGEKMGNDMEKMGEEIEKMFEGFAKDFQSKHKGK